MQQYLSLIHISRSRNEFLLKYHVRERWFKAEKTLPNQEVYEDSCVEFFVAPSDDGIYYNFEFNAIGTCLMGSGTGRHDRKRSDPSVIAGIRYLASAGSLPLPEREGDFEWKLTLAIPFSTPVSYTHLDVYKRQGGTNTVFGIVDTEGKVLADGHFKTTDYPDVKDFVKALGANVKKLLAGKKDLELVGIGTVSYTHLDVYKRQGYQFSIYRHIRAYHP